MIYKQNISKPFKENSELNPTNPYAFTKFTIENILQELYSSAPHKWRIANLRYFNPVGAHTSGQLGDNPTKRHEFCNFLIFSIVQPYKARLVL